MRVEINARNSVGDLHYRELNRQIVGAISGGATEIHVVDVRGQRYIGAGLRGHDVVIHVHGIPGQDLGAFLDGPTVIVHGNAQDGVANTANAGIIVVHDNTGDLVNHSSRGVHTFIRRNIGQRSAVHMKEYGDSVPWLIVGGTAGNYLGEYMAGGMVVVLDLQGDGTKSPVGSLLATGIHGGTVFVRGEVEYWQLGVGAKAQELEQADYDLLRQVVSEFCFWFGGNVEQIINERPFVKIVPISKRPFGKLYTPALPVGGGRAQHCNLTPPCTFACPSFIPTPAILARVRDGREEEALRLLDEYTPFRLACCGTVCDQLCVQQCSRIRVDGRPLDIRQLARDYHPSGTPELIEGKKEQEVAVIGAGPAGLSCSWQLARRGYQVTVFEAGPRIGGKMRLIPADRLPAETLEYDLARIKSLGIHIRRNTQVTAELFREIQKTYDAVVVATGAHHPRELQFPGSKHTISGLAFLKAIEAGQPIDVNGKRVVIIGAGNVGMDVACECWRLGAKVVAVVDIREPLSSSVEQERAKACGTKIIWPRFVTSFSYERKEIRFRDGQRLKAEMVILAVGEVPAYSRFLPDTVLRNGDGRIRIPEGSFRTTDLKVYVIGDAVSTGLITHAIGMGRLVALEIHANLQGHEFVHPKKELVPARRIQLIYFDSSDGQNEADRCLSCGTCVFCDICVGNCPQRAISREGQTFTVAETCTGCGTCEAVCPRGAVTVG